MITLVKQPLEGHIDSDHDGESKDHSLDRGVLAISAFDASRSGLLLESLLTQSGDRRGLTGMASWRITGTKRGLMADSNTSKVRGMYRAGVVAARSGSGEGVDGLGGLAMPREFDLLLKSNRHGVADVDGDDISPTSGDLIERICDCDSLVIDHHFWANEDQVSDRQEQSAPERRSDTTCEREVSEALVGVDQRSDRSEREEDIAASRTEEFGIGHGAILSRGVMVTIESTEGVTR